MRLLTLLFLLILTSSLTAQAARVNKRWLSKQDTARQAALAEAGTLIGSPLDRGISLHVMPLSFINVSSRFRFGAQLKRDRWSYLLDLEIGSDFTHAWTGDDNSRNLHFYGIRPELRCDLGAYRSGFYLGLELPVTWMNRTTNGSFSTAQGGRRRVEQVRQERFRASAIAKLGLQFLAGDHVLFDFYVGLGAAYRDVRYTERVGEVIDPLEEFELGLFSDLYQEGERLVPDLAAGFRIGWWF